MVPKPFSSQGHDCLFLLSPSGASSVSAISLPFLAWVWCLLSLFLLPLFSDYLCPICLLWPGLWGSLLLLPLWGCVSTPCLSLSLLLSRLLIPRGLIDYGSCLSIGVGIQVWLLEATIDGLNCCPGWMERQLGSLELLLGKLGSSFSCKDLRVDPARDESGGGPEGF